MAEMTIHLRCDPHTGKKDIIVSLKSDADALPLEHEREHKKLVEKLLEGGIVEQSELGRIIVERDRSEGATTGKDAVAQQSQRESLSEEG